MLSFNSLARNLEKSIQILSTYPLSEQVIEHAVRNRTGHHGDEAGREGSKQSPPPIQWTSAAFIQTRPYLQKETAQRIGKLASRSITAIFTSAHAVKAVFSLLNPKDVSDWKVYCLAGKTKENLLAYLPASAILATADYGKALAEKIRQLHQPPLTYYFFCGNIRMPTLPVFLSAHHIPLEEITVYKTVLTPQRVNASVDGILFFSPSAVRSFFELNKPGPKTILFSVGTTTSQAIGQFSDNPVITSPAPRVALVVKSVLDYFEKNPPGHVPSTQQ